MDLFNIIQNRYKERFHLQFCFKGDKHTLVDYSNSDMDEDISFRKSIPGNIIKFARGDVAWQSKLQKCIALSTIKEEFFAIIKACKYLLWLKNFSKTFVTLKTLISILHNTLSTFQNLSIPFQFGPLQVYLNSMTLFNSIFFINKNK